MKVESRFNPRVKGIVVLLVLLSCLMIASVYFLWGSDDLSIGGALVSGTVFAFFWSWLFFGEARTKAVRVSLGFNTITVSRYMGWGRSITFQFADIQGYRTSRLSSEYSSFEYLYLVAGDRKIVKLSEFYHQNYSELKKELVKKIKYLGNEQFSWARELREIFTWS